MTQPQSNPVYICSLPGDFSGADVVHRDLASGLCVSRSIYLLESSHHSGLWEVRWEKNIARRTRLLGPCRRTLFALTKAAAHQRWISIARRRLMERLKEMPEGAFVPSYDPISMGCADDPPESTKLVIIIHSDDEFWENYTKRFAERASVVVCVSRRLKDKVEAAHPRAIGKVHVIPNGVAVKTRLAPKPSLEQGLRLVYCGRLDETQKRVSMLVRIASLLKARGVKFQLTIAGDGPQRASLNAAVREEALEGCVSFCGWIPRSETARLFEQSHVFLLTSAYEGMPLALLEAMASGCVPVILGRISSGVPEIINDGGNGLLCSGEVEQVVSRLEHFSPKEMDAMGSEAWRTIRDGHFSMTRMLESYEALFQKVTASQRIKT